MVFLTFAIVLFAGMRVWILRQQQKRDRAVQAANYKLALFERRFYVYDKIMEYLTMIAEEGHIDPAKIEDFHAGAAMAAFLMPSTTSDLIDEMADRTLQLRMINERIAVLERDRNKLIQEKELTGDKDEFFLAEVEKANGEVRDHILWFHHKRAIVTKELEPF